MHQTFTNRNDIEVFHCNPFEMQNSKKKIWMHKRCIQVFLNICHLLSANFLPLIEIFFGDLSMFILSKDHCYTKARSIFKSCQTKFQIILKIGTCNFLPIFTNFICAFLQMHDPKRFLCGWIKTVNSINV